MDFVIDAREYALLCMNARTPAQVRFIVTILTASLQPDSKCWFYPKLDYNRNIGWALPTRQVCDLIVVLWQTYPTKTLVDLGAGSGVFCMMLNDAGIPKHKLHAVDQVEIPRMYKVDNHFWDIVHIDNYEVPAQDILFLAWGVFNLQAPLKSYIARGGWCVVILGEIASDDCCTFPSDYFAKKREWNCSLTQVQGPRSLTQEYLSINIRKVHTQT